MVLDPTFEGCRPIFIVGAPRSGTSVTTWALGQHPNIQPMPETGWIASMAVGGYLSYVKGSERGRYSHLSNVEYPLAPFMRRIGESIHHIVNDVFSERCQRMYPGFSSGDSWMPTVQQAAGTMQLKRAGTDPKHRWIDGTPLNTFYIWGLAQLFPEAVFIHNLRRPDEVATSLEGFDRVGAEPQALDQGLKTWIDHTENAWFVERGLGSARTFRLDFHRLGSAPEDLLHDVLDFLGEKFSEQCLLPLQSKLNSSQVDDRRRENLNALSGNPVFQRAMALYEAATDNGGGPIAEPEMMGVLQQRFMDYVSGRSIV